MEAKWSSLVSYGMSLDALKDFLPLEVTLDVKTVRYDTLKVAQRLEAELGDEQQRFIEGSPSDWDLLPRPDGAFKVGIDGGYVRKVAYLPAADNVLGPLPFRLRGLNQPVISPPNVFSGPRPPLLACI